MTLAISPPGLQKPAPWGIVPSLDPEWRGMWDGLLAAYMFWGGNNAGPMFDVTGNGFDGDIENSPTVVIGQRGQGLSFNGTTHNIEVGDHDLFSFTGTMPFAIVCLAEFNTKGGIFSKYLSPNFEYVCGQLSTNQRLYFWRYKDSTAEWRGRTAPEPSAGEHVVIFQHTGGGDSADCEIWVDGVQVDDTNFQSGSGPMDIENMPAPVRIGGQNTGLGMFNGKLYFLDVYRNRSFTPTEIQRITADLFGPFRMAGVPVWKAPVAGGDVFGVLALSAAGTLGLVGAKDAAGVLSLIASGTLTVVPIADRAGVLALNGAGTMSLAAAKDAAGVLALTASGTLTVVPIAELAGVLALNGIATLSASPFVAVTEPPHVSDRFNLQTVVGPKITVITVASELTDVQTVISEELEASP